MKTPSRWIAAVAVGSLIAAAGWQSVTADQATPAASAPAENAPSTFALPTDGTTMPEVSLADLDHLAKNHGKKLLVVNLWATWCAPCVKELPYFAEADAAFRDRGVQFVGVSLDSQVEDDWRPTSAKTVADKNVKYPIVGLPASIGSDEFVAFFSEEWSGAIPATFYYDETGKKVGERLSEVSKEELFADIERLLGEGPKATTPSGS